VFSAPLWRAGGLQPDSPGGAGNLSQQNFWLVEKEVQSIERIGCRVVNWTEPEYPQ
jgi:hypothetical protein